MILNQQIIFKKIYLNSSSIFIQKLIDFASSGEIKILISLRNIDNGIERSRITFIILIYPNVYLSFSRLDLDQKFGKRKK